ncbi:hypothetical protein SG34_005615 [Thalassomonas viridans]|uniref:Uncharacterized protein n=1 Tax=Thalassomonas viridans TaxID=137584 RepID=A0AAE9Z5F4_9GAMM|nr:hypothetical protein [Thalassomonas viridans]WDE06399.1 hypothetical protein SG34_005615 [Thalassomonas viridans]
MYDSDSIDQDDLPDCEAKLKQIRSKSLELCDSFNKFSDECSFLCDAFAAVAREPDCITPETSEGIWYVNYRLKMQIRDYRDQIDEIHQGLQKLKLEQ